MKQRKKEKSWEPIVNNIKEGVTSVSNTVISQMIQHVNKRMMSFKKKKTTTKKEILVVHVSIVVREDTE